MHTMAQAGSQLLRFLPQMHDEVWAQVLLPKLMADGSAPSLALTCSTLRQLCHRSRAQLQLTALASTDTATVRQWMEPLPERFPACSNVTIRVCEKSCTTVPIIVDALARMPHLSTLKVFMTVGQQPVAMAVAISSISTHLPQLRDLTLASTDGLASAQQVWEQLGTTTQLTSLSVHYNHQGGSCTLRNFEPLRGLSRLQRLGIKGSLGYLQEQGGQQQAEGQQQQQEGEGGSFAFLGALTALTCLEIPVPSTSGLSSISSCTALQVLRLHVVTAASDNAGRLRPLACEAIGQLTRLTEMRTASNQRQLLADPPQPFYAALQKLTLLQTVFAPVWTPAVLPVLAGLPQLRCVGGSWSSNAGGPGVGRPAEAICQGVTALAAFEGLVDFEAFPNLEVIRPTGALSWATWQSMASCCPKLRDVCSAVDLKTGMLIDRRQASCSAILGAERLSAVRSLSQLTALTRLSWRCVNHLEVAALADALPRLQELHIVALPGMECMCLTPLAKLPSLCSLCCYLATCPLHPGHVQVLLSVVSHLPLVVVAGAADTAVFVRSAVAGACAVGLRLPGRLRVMQLASVS